MSNKEKQLINPYVINNVEVIINEAVEACFLVMMTELTIKIFMSKSGTYELKILPFESRALCLSAIGL